MILNERQNQIIRFLKERNRASVRKLAAHFFVSEMTIRRDLKELESQGYLKRYNGGAVYCEDNPLPIESRRFLHADEKKRLSEAARKYLHDSITVFLDSSSTCLYILPIIAEYKDIKVVTNSIPCLLDASKYHISCLMAGGSFFARDMCTVGGETERFLRSLNIDIGFYSSGGFSEDGVISDKDENQTSIRKTAMQSCEKNIFFFDSEKKNKKFFYILCQAKETDEVVII